ADDRLIFGHRLSEWCGKGPTLEEDIALANIALDLMGQSNAILSIAAEQKGNNGVTADSLAFFRDAIDFRNCKLVELPRSDFSFEIVRLFIFSSYSVLRTEVLAKSSDPELAGIA